MRTIAHAYSYLVFVSYSRSDGRETARKLCEALAQHGIPTWRDERDLNPYLDFGAEIEAAIERASHVAICLTPSIARREDSYVQREIIHALNCDKRIIPLLFSGFPEGKIPLHVNHLTYLQLQDPEDVLSLLERLRIPLTGYEPPKPNRDPFTNHVERLRSFAVNQLRLRLRSERLMSLHSRETPDAVANPMPAAYEAVKRQAFFGEGEGDRPEEFMDFPEAFEHADMRVLLLGDPGSGKTTTLLAFARDAAYARLSDRRALLPVYAPISTWDGRAPLLEWLSAAAELDLEALRDILQQKRALLLLDGLDELASPKPRAEASDDARARFITALSELTATPTVVTCRRRDYEVISSTSGQRLSLNSAVTLKPLSNEQIKGYLRDHPELWIALQKDSSLLDMARTPLILALLIDAYGEAEDEVIELADLASSPGDLRDKIFTAFVRRRYEHERRRSAKLLACTLDQLYEVLGEVALLIGDSEDSFLDASFESLSPDTAHQIETGQYKILVTPSTEIERGELQRMIGTDRKELIELYEAMQLLVPASGGRLRFIHLLLRDHFGFVHCKNMLSNAGAEIEKRKEALLGIIMLDDARGAGLISSSLNDPDPRLRVSAALALSIIGDKKSIPYLSELLGSSDNDVRLEAILGLIVLGDRKAVKQAFKPLAGILRDNDAELRTVAALALGWLGDARAIIPLSRSLWKDSDDDVRMAAGFSLALLGVNSALKVFSPQWARSLERFPQTLMTRLYPSRLKVNR